MQSPLETADDKMFAMEELYIGCSPAAAAAAVRCGRRSVYHSVYSQVGHSQILSSHKQRSSHFTDMLSRTKLEKKLLLNVCSGCHRTNANISTSACRKSTVYSVRMRAVVPRFCWENQCCACRRRICGMNAMHLWFGYRLIVTTMIL
jgi:hypothetical protein